MKNPTLTITSISTENNYLKIEGTIRDPKTETETPPLKSIGEASESIEAITLERSITSYYPRKSTSFNIEQEAEVSEKGTVYTNYYVISNHMGLGRIRISELLIGNVKQGSEGKAFTSQTFTEFMTESTGA